MPISSFYGLHTSLRGLLAQQRALDTTGHNVANASTAGYSRQEAVMAAAPALVVAHGAIQGGDGAHIGGGVDVQAYRRVRDTFLDLQYRAQATRLGEEAAKAETLGRAELTLAEPSDDGISKQLAEFFDAWHNVAESAGDNAARTQLVGQGETLADAFRTVDSQLELIGEQAADEYAALAGPGGEVEQTAREIVALNDTIQRFVTAGNVPNDLLDARDVLLDKLAGLAQTSVTENGDGSVSVVFGGPGDPPMIGPAGYTAPALSSPGGRLGGLRDVSAVPGGRIDAFRLELSAAAKTLADSVNAIHGTGGGPAFFSYADAPPASYVASTLTVAVTPGGVRPSVSTEEGANELARQISELRGGAGDSAYSAFVTRMGTEVRAAARAEANAQALSDAVADRRESVAGVSLDEEMGNLIRFQRAYQASARAMSTFDEMLDVLINRTGRVGL